MQVWIGTSGFSYADWVGEFYPPGTSPRRMLAYYSRHFPVVELNFTFYRPPTPAMLARLADQAPAGFQFLVKLPRSLSHEQDRRDLAGFRLATEELRRRGQLLGLLCQMPQATHYGPKPLEWLRLLGEELAGPPLAIEFRHRSWFRPELPGWLLEHHLDLVAVDVPDLAGLYPRGLVQSGPRVYARFHSRNAQNWYRSDKERYDFDYDDQALNEWVDALTGVAERTTNAWVLFNNCHRGQAAANARRMRELLAARGLDFQLVGPFASTPEGANQGMLFE